LASGIITSVVHGVKIVGQLHCSRLGNDRVDIFYRVANPSIWMYYLPDPSTNQVLFVCV